MNMLLRPYGGRDITVILQSQKRGALLDGIAVDAQMWACMPQAFSNLRCDIPSATEVLLDPVTYKIERPFFRKKPRSYGRLKYFLTSKFGNRAPSPRDLADHTSDVVRGVFDVQNDFGVQSYLTPSLYIAPADFSSGSKDTHFSVWAGWANEFRKKHPGCSVMLSLCIHQGCLRTQAAMREIKAFVRDHAPKAVCLMLVDFDLGQNREVDDALFDFLDTMRSHGVSRIVWSHAPLWIGFLRNRGVTDFISGINMQALAKLENLERDSDEGGIPNNYYIPWRFCRMTPEQARDAVQRGIVTACSCPVCRSGVPIGNESAIREHYVHARLMECNELRAANDSVALLRARLDEAERFVVQAKQEGLAAKGSPTPTLWRHALP